MKKQIPLLLTAILSSCSYKQPGSQSITHTPKQTLVDVQYNEWLSLTKKEVCDLDTKDNLKHFGESIIYNIETLLPNMNNSEKANYQKIKSDLEKYCEK